MTWSDCAICLEHHQKHLDLYTVARAGAREVTRATSKTSRLIFLGKKLLHTNDTVNLRSESSYEICIETYRNKLHYSFTETAMTRVVDETGKTRKFSALKVR